jgi:hypothetical protein
MPRRRANCRLLDRHLQHTPARNPRVRLFRTTPCEAALPAKSGRAHGSHSLCWLLDRCRGPRQRLRSEFREKAATECIRRGKIVAAIAEGGQLLR